jgi:hypothetical protein
MSEQQPKMLYSRILAYAAFIFATVYIFKVEEPSKYVLSFYGIVIAYWALGRATLSELIEALNSKWSK